MSRKENDFVDQELINFKLDDKQEKQLIKFLLKLKTQSKDARLTSHENIEINWYLRGQSFYQIYISTITSKVVFSDAANTYAAQLTKKDESRVRKLLKQLDIKNLIAKDLCFPKD